MKPRNVHWILLAVTLACWLAPGCDVEQKSQPSGDAAADSGGTENTAAKATPEAAVESKPVEKAPSSLPAADNQFVVLNAGAGEIVIALDDGAAPKHSANFRGLVQRGFYNGKTFHRVIDGVLAQAGDPNPAGDGTGSEGPELDSEIKLKHKVGSVGMARRDDSVNPNRKSVGSQFYIVVTGDSGALAELDSAGYTVFGQVVQGLENARKIPGGDPGKDDIVPVASRAKIASAQLKVLDIKPEEPKKTATPASSATDGGGVYAVLETDVQEGDGKVYIDLFEEKSPLHSANFMKLIKEGYYEGSPFHRVIEGFMCQGGGGATGGDVGYKVDAEIGLPHHRGSVAAARQGDQVNPKRQSSGSQFYICFVQTSHLDSGYSVFGHVVKGMKVVDKVKRGTGTPNPNKIVKAYTVPASSVKIETPPPKGSQ